MSTFFPVMYGMLLIFTYPCSAQSEQLILSNDFSNEGDWYYYTTLSSPQWLSGSNPYCTELGGTDCVLITPGSYIWGKLSLAGFTNVRIVLDSREEGMDPSHGDECYMQYKGTSSDWVYTLIADSTGGLQRNLEFILPSTFDDDAYFEVRFGNSGQSTAGTDYCYMDNLRIYGVPNGCSLYSACPGSACVFPWKYDGVTYNGCITVDNYDGMYWCGYDSPYQSGQNRWENCCCFTAAPSTSPSASPSKVPTSTPTTSPSNPPSNPPSAFPSRAPSSNPTSSPSDQPSASPSKFPSDSPTQSPTASTATPSTFPSVSPSESPSNLPTTTPTQPSTSPTQSPTASTAPPSSSPSNSPSSSPTETPTTSQKSIEDVGSSDSLSNLFGLDRIGAVVAICTLILICICCAMLVYMCAKLQSSSDPDEKEKEHVQNKELDEKRKNTNTTCTTEMTRVHSNTNDTMTTNQTDVIHITCTQNTSSPYSTSSRLPQQFPSPPISPPPPPPPELQIVHNARPLPVPPLQNRQPQNPNQNTSLNVHENDEESVEDDDGKEQLEDAADGGVGSASSVREVSFIVGQGHSLEYVAGLKVYDEFDFNVRKSTASQLILEEGEFVVDAESELNHVTDTRGMAKIETRAYRD